MFMAKNRTMAAKNDKAKRLRMKEIKEANIREMCHTAVSMEIVFYTPYLPVQQAKPNANMQIKVKAFMGKHYNVVRFQKRYPEIYEYLYTHKVPETKVKFATEFDLIMQGLL